jgi:hypothetical protein
MSACFVVGLVQQARRQVRSLAVTNTCAGAEVASWRTPLLHLPRSSWHRDFESQVQHLLVYPLTQPLHRHGCIGILINSIRHPHVPTPTRPHEKAPPVQCPRSTRPPTPPRSPPTCIRLSKARAPPPHPQNSKPSRSAYSSSGANKPRERPQNSAMSSHPQ